MAKENFHRRFRLGSEAFTVLTEMATSKWEAYWAKVDGLKQQQRERLPSLIKGSRDKPRSHSLVDKAGLTPSQPDYYDIRVNLQKIASQIKLPEASSSRNLLTRSHRSEIIRGPEPLSSRKPLAPAISPLRLGQRNLSVQYAHQSPCEYGLYKQVAHTLTKRTKFP